MPRVKELDNLPDGEEKFIFKKTKMNLNDFSNVSSKAPMRDFDIWKSYIDALDILTNQYSEPFDIKVLEVKNDTSVICRFIDTNQQDKIFEGLLKLFPSLKKENINYQENHLLYPSSEAIYNSKSIIEGLKSFADSNYFEFSTTPAFSGTFKYNRTPLIDFFKKYIVNEETQPQKKSLIQHIGIYYPNSIFKEKSNGEIIVLDETYLNEQTLQEWGEIYTVEYILTVKEIINPIKISIASDKVLDITHSKIRNKINIRLSEKISEFEIREIRTKLIEILNDAIGKLPEISLNAVFTQNNFRNELKTKKASTNQNYGKIQFLTLKELEDIDAELETNPDVFREQTLGAIFKIDFSETYINKQYDNAIKLLKEQMDLEPYKVEGFSKQIHLRDVFIKKDVFDAFKKNTFYSNSFHRVSFIITPDEFEKFEQGRKNRKIYYKFEDKPNLEGIILPDPNNNVFILTFSESISLSDLQFEIFFFKNTLMRYFGKEHIQIVHEIILRIDKQRFLKQIKEVIPNDDFQISSDSETISFNFKTKEELDEKLKKLDTYDYLNYLGFSENHKYKVTFGHITPLIQIKDKLDNLNFTKTILNESGSRLKVFGLISDISKLSIIKANIENAAGNFTQDNIQLNWDAFDRGLIKYYFHFDEESYKKEVHKKLDNLRGESLTLANSKEVLGVLKSISYPNLIIQMEDKILLEEGTCLTVKSALKGEKDKVKRSRDAVQKIYSNSGNAICNKNLKQALIDSSTLQSSIGGDITLTNEYQTLYNKVNGDLLSPYINKRQKEAIVKCLLSEDLFIIQGPPGTGKSTAIAELIWQHLANNNSDKRYRILVTSETNLAVDNALNKLRSSSHLLMKPMRFGSVEKLDDEGRRFSIEAINYWKKNEWEANYSLILDDWVDLINSRCTNPNNDSYIKLWKEHLTEKGKDLREKFYFSYVKNCNVIGATCSSIGKINSEGKFTRFFQDYANVFYPDEFEEFKSSPNRSSLSALKKKEIEFDLAIQDEASKASPPELALPFTHSKKAVIIGDHRQLPPMIDTNEFVEKLIYLKYKSKEDQQIKKISELIRFIINHRESFEYSHFEKLFTNIDINLKSTFDTQYRMHPAINETIKQFYKGDFENGADLKCGLPWDSVEDPNLNNPMSRYHGITRKKDTHVIWVDVQTPEVKKGTSRINHGEVKAIEWIIKTITSNENYATFINHWKENDNDQKELGVITFYGEQAELIKKNIPEGINIRVSPVDRFQGMERNIIIVSLVRSNHIAENENQQADFETFDNEYGYPLNDSLGFAESPNRLNVALSRAKRLLIVVGNSKHFSQKEIYKNVFETIKNHPQGEVWEFKE